MSSHTVLKLLSETLYCTSSGPGNGIFQSTMRVIVTQMFAPDSQHEARSDPRPRLVRAVTATRNILTQNPLLCTSYTAKCHEPLDSTAINSRLYMYST